MVNSSQMDLSESMYIKEPRFKLQSQRILINHQPLAQSPSTPKSSKKHLHRWKHSSIQCILFYDTPLIAREECCGCSHPHQSN
ncbi:hypothetical protein HN873_016709 [Arachis hypogaea]